MSKPLDNDCVDMLVKYIRKLESENARLKAEVERLTPLLGDIVPFDEYHKLLQQVERLTKAGDVMAIMLQYDEVSKEWNDAKKGGQP